MKPIFTTSLGDLYGIEINGRNFECDVKAEIYEDELPFDGDDPEDKARFERGEISNYTIVVKADCFGLKGFDLLGACTMSSNWSHEMTDYIQEHSMITNALNELTENIERILKHFSKEKS